jgi:hypothetical protein
MRFQTIVLIAAAAAGACSAQQWEAGASGGLGFTKNVTVTRGSSSASAGFKTGAAVGGFLSQNLYEHVGGEFRYTFQFSNLKLSSGGTNVDFSGQTHAIHYDLLYYFNGRDAKMRPFVTGGGGARVYRGTGQEILVQPLSNYAILTKTQEVKGLVVFGGGLKFKVGRSYVYAQVLDYLTPAPTQVIAPVPGAKLGGWIHDFVPMVSLSAAF